MRLPFLASLLVLGLSPLSVRAQTAGGQPPGQMRSREIRDTALVNALSNVEILGEAAPVNGTQLAVRVLSLAGASGSARDGESDRVVNWLFVAISDFGEEPEQHVFRLGSFFDPKLDSLVAQGAVPIAFISYGATPKRQRAKVLVTLRSVRLLPIRTHRS